MATVNWKEKAVDKAKIATDLDREAETMKDREAQVGSHHCSRAMTWCTAYV